MAVTRATKLTEKDADVQMFPAFWLEKSRDPGDGNQGLWRGVYGRFNSDNTYSEAILTSEWSTKQTAVDYLMKTLLQVRRDLEVKIGKPVKKDTK